MTTRQDQREELRRKAADLLGGLSHEEREALLVSCWMAHDARWFTAVAEAFGLEAANRLNQRAAHDAGEAEARRIVRALHLPKVASRDDYVVVQEAFIGLLGPELLDYQVSSIGDDAYQLRVQRCFAYEQVTRAGIAGQYDCGIFARVTGWLDALGLPHELTPPLGKCLMAQGRECTYTIRITAEAPSLASTP